MPLVDHVDLDGSVGMRECAADAPAHSVDRYGLGLHHAAFEAPSRTVVDQTAACLREQSANMEGGPGAGG
jgi:hypothetical protein